MRKQAQGVSRVLSGDEIHLGEHLERPLADVGKVAYRRCHDVKHSAERFILFSVVKSLHLFAYCLSSVLSSFFSAFFAVFSCLGGRAPMARRAREMGGIFNIA